MASTNTKTPVPRRPVALRAAVCALPLLGALLTNASGAQAVDDLSRLIFEVAPIPADGAAPVAGGTAGNGGAVAAATSAPAEPVNVQADVAAYRARINDTQANANPYSQELREQYDSLGTLLQQSGDHEEAIKAFEAAMHIDRVNAGLYTLDQIPIVEKIIASHEALGNFSEVDDFHGYLFYIQQRSYDDGDPRLLAAQEEWADWNIESYLKDSARYGDSVTFETGSGGAGRVDYVAVQDPRNGSFTYVPRAQLMTAMNPLGRAAYFDPTFMQSHGVDAERVIDERLRTARTYYEDIIEVTAPDEGNADAAAGPDSAANADDTHRVERKLANVAYAIKNQLDGIDRVQDEGSLYFNNRLTQNYSPPQAVTRGYQRNRDALTASAEKLEQDPAASPLEKAQAWIDVGDWHTGFDYAQRGSEAYRKAWDLLRGAGLNDAEIDSIFMPAPLVPAPAFAIHRYSREIFGIDPNASIDYKGHMDLTLDVNRYGDVAGIKIDSAVPEVSQVLRSELVDYLRTQKMRPAFIDGEPVKRDDVKLRYYYSY